MADLEKKFVWVSGTVEGKKITDIENDLKAGGKYYKSIVFDHENGVIWNHGKKYGMSDSAVAALNTLVNTLDKAVNGDAEGPTKGLLERVTDIETLIGVVGDDNATIDKLQEVLDWFKGVSEAGSEDQPGVQLIADVAAAKTAIGEKGTPGTPAVKYTQEEIDAAKAIVEEEGYVPGTDTAAEELASKTTDDIKTPASEGTPSTGLYKEIADAVAEAAGDSAEIAEDLGDVEKLGKDAEGEAKEGSKVAAATDVVDAINKLDDAILAMDVAETTKTSISENVKVTYKETDGIVEIVEVETLEVAATYTEATETDPADLSVAEADKTKLLTAGSVGAIKSYIDAVAAANQEGLSVVVSADGADAAANTGIAEVDADDDHKLTIKTSTLGSVGLEKNGEGKWVAGTANTATGLATAADVAAEIVSDEEVIAAAFNDHESRVAAMEHWDSYDWEEM